MATGSSSSMGGMPVPRRHSGVTCSTAPARARAGELVLVRTTGRRSAMRFAELMFANLVAFAAFAQPGEPMDELNQALAASESLAIATAQTADPALAEAGRRAHFQFLR